MINIFYNPVYIKSKKVFITKHLKHSKLVNLFIDLNYFLNTPIHENLIQSGPHKRMNNLIKTFKKDNEINFNSIKFSNNYVIQYDDYGKNIVNKIINSKDPNKKIIIGPLYNIDQDLEINTLIKKHNYIKKLVASEVAYKNAFEMDSDINLDNVMICPSGIIYEHDVVNNIEISKREDKCLIYFKKRSREDLNLLIEFLNERNQEYELFEYGKYKNKDLKNAAKKYSFGVIMSRPETQGFGIQEIMACNLPLLVWDQTTNFYEHLQLSGTTVTVWDEKCGKIVLSINELKNAFDDFKKKS